MGRNAQLSGGEVDVEEYTGDAGPDYIDSGDQVEETQFVLQTTIALSGWHVSVVMYRSLSWRWRGDWLKPIPIVQAVSRVLKAAEFVRNSVPLLQSRPRGITCFDGQWRKCGTKLGACEYGQEYCVDGSWSGVL